MLWYTDKPVGKRTGLFVASSVGESEACIDNGYRQITAFVDRLKQYHERVPDAPNPLGSTHSPVAANDSERPTESPSPQSANDSPRDNTPTNMGPNTRESRVDGALSRRLDEIFGTQSQGPPLDNAIPIDTFVVTILRAEDPRTQQPDFYKAKQKEVEG